ncbi:hypothetical protein AGMMS50249_2020 [candidate division SR1 bacterium]|nr:hypothetical protein AGMMS50249_2020 [candidate division SR1 bacterium]
MPENQSTGNILDLLKHVWNAMRGKFGKRLSRGEFILSCLLLAVIGLILSKLRFLSGIGSTFFMQTFGEVRSPFRIPVGIFVIILAIRRLHDLGMPWIWILSPIAPLLLLPFVSINNTPASLLVFVFLLYFLILGSFRIGVATGVIICCCKKGDIGDNKYGIDTLIVQKEFKGSTYMILAGILLIFAILLQFDFFGLY